MTKGELTRYFERMEYEKHRPNTCPHCKANGGWHWVGCSIIKEAIYSMPPYEPMEVKVYKKADDSNARQQILYPFNRRHKNY